MTMMFGWNMHVFAMYSLCCIEFAPRRERRVLFCSPRKQRNCLLVALPVPHESAVEAFAKTPRVVCHSRVPFASKNVACAHTMYLISGGTQDPVTHAVSANQRYFVSCRSWRQEG